MFNCLNQLCVGMVNIAIEKATFQKGNQHIFHDLSKLFASKIIKNIGYFKQLLIIFIGF